MTEVTNNVVELKPTETPPSTDPEAYRKYRDEHRDWIIRHLPHWTVDLLKEIRQVAPEAFIAGGLLRDLCNLLDIGKLKDVDIFLLDGAGAYEKVIEIVKKSHPEIVDLIDMTDDYGDWECDNRGVHAVLECRSKIEGVLPVNLIFLLPQFFNDQMTVEGVIGDFDFGMCQVGFDGEKIIATEAFWEDQAYHKFTLTRCHGWGDFDRSMQRFERFQAKYMYTAPAIPELEIPERTCCLVRLEFASQFKHYEPHTKSLEELRVQVKELEKAA